MKLGNVDIYRKEDGWHASVAISSSIDKSGFTFSVGPSDNLISLFKEVGEVTEGLIGFTTTPRKRKISDRALQRAVSGYDSSKMFLTVPGDDL